MTNPPTTVIVGSVRFADTIARVEREFALNGRPVLAYSLPLSGEADLTTEQLDRLATRHRRMIDLADEVHVVNPGGYIGESTRNEIAYAERVGKPVTFMTEEKP